MLPVEQTRVADNNPASLNQQWFSVQSKAEFIEGAPHLKHPQLRSRCSALAREIFEKVPKGKNVPLVLDMGAGDGTLTVPYLEMGAKVTAADVTVEFLESLKQRAASFKDSLTVMPGDIFATVGKLGADSQTFDLVCASAFLHHIPDYLKLCRLACGLVKPGGVFFTFQDPLRYDTLG